MITRYKVKNPRVIEAIRYWGTDESFEEAAKFTHQTFDANSKNKYIQEEMFPIHNFMGQSKVAIVGDYIAKTSRLSSDFDVYKPDLFEAIYEQVH